MNGRAAALLQLLRPLNCVMMGLAVWIGQFLTSSWRPDPAKMALSFATAFTLTGMSMIVNDLYDVEVDRKNAPHRPLPSGRVGRQEALAFAVLLGLVGLVSAAVTSLLCLSIAAIFAAIATAYSARGKQTGLMGNVLVSLSVAVPFVYGGAVEAGATETLLLYFFAMAFFSCLGREITKGIADVEGDPLRGVRSLALTSGKGVAARAAGTCFLLAVAITPAPYVSGLVGPAYLALAGAADIGFLAVVALLLKDPEPENARRVKRIALYVMLVGLAAFFAGEVR